MSDPTGLIYEFGDFRFDVVKRELRKNGILLSLTPKVLDTLRVLIQNQGEVVTKELLMNEVWGDAFVEESGLMRNISVLRKALDGNESGIPHIVTVPRQGYRFLSAVRTAKGKVAIRELTRTRILVEENETPDDKVSLAVLPFRTHSTGSATDHSGLGMADALITKLSNIRELQVRPTSSVLKFDHTSIDAKEAARELEVDSVIEGMIWHAGDRMRVTVQLVNRDSDVSLWAETFDGAYGDIFDIQDVISTRVAETLQFGLSGQERKLLAKQGTENLEAYRLFVRALFLMHHFTPKQTALAIPILEEAIELDPNYALARAYLAGCYLQKASFNVSSATEIDPIVRPVVEKALLLDPDLPGAHYAMGFVHLFLDWDLRKAERSFARAVKLNPNDAIANKHLGMLLFADGRFDEAIDQAKITRKLDPVTASNTAHVGLVHYYARRFEESIAWHRIALEMDPKFLHSRIGLAWSLIKIGATRDALQEIESIEGSMSTEPSVIAAHGYAAAAAGDEELARKAIKKLLALSKKRYISAMDISTIFCELGQSDEAFEWLEKAIAERSVWLIFLKVNPRFDKIRSDVRFDSILNRIVPASSALSRVGR